MREIRPYGSVRGVRRKPYPYRDSPTTAAQQRFSGNSAVNSGLTSAHNVGESAGVPGLLFHDLRRAASRNLATGRNLRRRHYEDRWLPHAQRIGMLRNRLADGHCRRSEEARSVLTIVSQL